MARFPEAEAEIVVLAQGMMAGLKAHGDLYPSPPVDPEELDGVLQVYLQARDRATLAQAEAQQAIADKNEALQALVDDLKSDLRYAENTVNGDDTQLKRLGWGGKKSRTTQQLPGQCRSLEAPRQGAGWVFLDWKEPVEGGKVVAYTVQMRPEGTEPWQVVATALISEVSLVNQERGKALEFRVMALNKVGEGDPSNTVTVVL